MISVPNFLFETNSIIFNKLGIEIKSVSLEKESALYNACQLVLNNRKVLFRTAKITPTKTGQFVTLWKRIPNTSIAPFEINDDFELVIIQTKTETQLGYFIFQKNLLIEKGIFSTDSKEGKRALRVYPSWDQTTSKQAQKTQQWQLDYFMEFPFENDKINSLFF